MNSNRSGHRTATPEFAHPDHSDASFGDCHAQAPPPPLSGPARQPGQGWGKAKSGHFHLHSSLVSAIFLPLGKPISNPSFPWENQFPIHPFRGKTNFLSVIRESGVSHLYAIVLDEAV